MKLKRSEVFLPLTQALLKIFEVINIEPNFHTVKEIAEALAVYYLQLSFHKLKLPPSTAYYYFQKLQNYLEELPKPRRVAIDETKILHVKGKYYYLWVIVDIDTSKVVKIYMPSGRSGVNVYKIINQLGKDILYIHDKGPWYNMLYLQGVPNKHEKFGIRNVVEQMFRIVKHRLASMNKHFPASSTKETITKWMKIFFTIYN